MSRLLPFTVRRIALVLPCPTMAKDTVCVQTCKSRRFALQRVARFMNKVGRQKSYSSAAADFRRGRRLTGFRSARRIVRIRTICPGGRKQDMMRRRLETRLVHDG